MRRHSGRRCSRPNHRFASGGLYRSREGMILGVCQGLADHFDINAFWIRAAFVLLFLLSGFWPVIGIYLAAALIMKPRPVKPITNDAEQEFYESYVNSPSNAAQRLKRQFDKLDRRIKRMEDKVTSKDFEWEKKFNSQA